MPDPTPPELVVSQALARCFCAPSQPPCGDVCTCAGCASDALTALSAAGYVVVSRDADLATRHTALLADAAAKDAEIERLREENAGLRAELDGARHNTFYDQRDAYFEGRKDERNGI